MLYPLSYRGVGYSRSFQALGLRAVGAHPLRLCAPTRIRLQVPSASASGLAGRPSRSLVPIALGTSLRSSHPHARKAVCVLWEPIHFVYVLPRGFEPRFRPPQGRALSIELWEHYSPNFLDKASAKESLCSTSGRNFSRNALNCIGFWS
jgi:hypothetical protein